MNIFTIGDRVIWRSRVRDGRTTIEKVGTICRVMDDHVTIKIFDHTYGEWYYRKVSPFDLRPAGQKEVVQ